MNSYALSGDYKVFSWGSYKNNLLGFGKKKENIYAPKIIKSLIKKEKEKHWFKKYRHGKEEDIKIEKEIPYDRYYPITLLEKIELDQAKKMKDKMTKSKQIQ